MKYTHASALQELFDQLEVLRRGIENVESFIRCDHGWPRGTANELYQAHRSLLVVQERIAAEVKRRLDRLETRKPEGRAMGD